MAATATIINRPDHTISRKLIRKSALKVLYGLKEAGFQAYLVGGSVRDLLLGLSPKDFDVATNATPEQIKATFSNCRLIGRRFRLAHVRFGREIIEVATFRGDHGAGGDGVTDGVGRIVRDNVFGDISDDVMRRDFTANALYYNIADFSIIDYTGGINDLHSKTLRLIGDAVTRYREDPVRMLRAARFCAKLGFSLHPQSAEPITRLKNLLRDVHKSRLFDETLKLFQTGHALASLQQLQTLDLLQFLLPGTDQALKAEATDFEKLLHCALSNTDRRVAAGQPVNPAFIIATFLWPQTLMRSEAYRKKDFRLVTAYLKASEDEMARQTQIMSIPRRFSIIAREILAMQARLTSASGQRALCLLASPRFRASYDFLCLRQQAGEKNLDKWVRKWTDLQEKTDGQELSQQRPPERPRRTNKQRKK